MTNLTVEDEDSPLGPVELKIIELADGWHLQMTLENGAVIVGPEAFPTKDEAADVFAGRIIESGLELPKYH